MNNLIDLSDTLKKKRLSPEAIVNTEEFKAFNVKMSAKTQLKHF